MLIYQKTQGTNQKSGFSNDGAFFEGFQANYKIPISLSLSERTLFCKLIGKISCVQIMHLLCVYGYNQLREGFTKE